MEQLFAALPQLLKELGANHAVEEQMVFAAWQRVAGEMLNERTNPLEYFENCLVVAVEDLSWQRNLESLAPQMIARLNGATEQGAVKYIEFRIDKKSLERSSTRNSKLEIGTSSVPDSLRAAAEHISDEHLRKSFLDAAAAYLDHS